MAGLVVVLAGCASLPPPSLRVPEHARPPSVDAPLVGIAQASLPAAQPGLSGFRLLLNAESSFNLRVALARRAVQTLDAQYYLWADDGTGRGLLRELRDAAQRGVRVRLLVDDLHAGDAALLADLAAHPNVQVRLFNPLPVRGASPAWRVLWSLHEFGRVNRRMHNKLYVADNALAVSGGRNVGDAYFMNDPDANFLDLDVLSAGPVVRELSAVFDAYWNSDAAYPVEQLLGRRPIDEARTRFDAAVRDATTRLGERQRDWAGLPSPVRQLDEGRLGLVHARARVLADPPRKAIADGDRGPTALPSVAEQALARLAQVREEALIVSAYFIPGERGMEVIRALEAGGAGRVILVTNSIGSTDEPLAYAGYARYRAALLRAGLRIHEVSPTLARDSGRVAYLGSAIGRLHTKTLTIDHRWLFIGSMNLDPRSTRDNTEAALEIDSPELAAQMYRVFRDGILAGTYRLRLAGSGDRIEWVETDWQGRQTVHAEEPHHDLWLRLKLWLLGSFVPEDLL
ncbi:MAG: phospholipase D family protein [Rubrivivax sp.]|nr:phospholipase D family protein [Rubrivivax sp.]